MNKIFVDGSAGTTGLKIIDRLVKRKDIELISLPDELRKDVSARQDAINSADIVFLCLPDDAARESVSLVKSDKVKIIDTSTAHRTNCAWEYGFPEIQGRRERIAKSKRIANPGCHASGFISLIAPLIDAGVMKKDEKLTCFSLTGYTGGGKKMIAEYESADKPTLYNAPRQYGLSQSHKHLPEMSVVCGLENSPVFCPIVASFPQGMEVTIPLFKNQIGCVIDELKEIYKSVYTGKLVHFDETDKENGFLSAGAYEGRDDMSISVYGNQDRILLVSRFDNLGKGASGAAIQNMNILLGVEETTGLNF
ncbi:MAG: N-acetyl-gamma-glutamyl-phosphate reductase [Clostridia bacterium]|nr:N-acetyl-gamma-glutamyl-phosphate reductase [Clostridia bacterium]